MTNNDNIKIFDDVSCHLKLETELLEAVKPKISAYITEFSSHKVSRPKHKKSKIRIASGQIKKVSKISQCSNRDKHRKNKSKLACFNCGKQGHLTYN